MSRAFSNNARLDRLSYPQRDIVDLRMAKQKLHHAEVPSSPIGTCQRTHSQYRQPAADYRRTSRIMLKGVSAARRTRPKPPLVITSRSRFSPARAPRAAPTSWAREVRQADHGRSCVIEAADTIEVFLQRVADSGFHECTCA
jgi:hypothetical protein